MLRPLLAFVTLCAAAILLAPTVTSLHEQLERTDVRRPMPWLLWKWDNMPQPPGFGSPTCTPRDYWMTSEVTRWPQRITKNQTFEIGGRVWVDTLPDKPGVGEVTVDVFLNETKEKPGHRLGVVATQGDGSFTLSARIPFDLTAKRYHIVVHALDEHKGCTHYHEHWSDPEMDVTAKTRIVFDEPPRIVVGHEMYANGTLLDEVDAPVRHAHVNVTIDGRRVTLVTDGNGRFSANRTATRPGEVDVEAAYNGTAYYAPSKATTTLRVIPEDVELDLGVDGALVLVRNEPRELRGRIFVPPGTDPGPVALTFDGIRVRGCPTCDPSATVRVEPDEEGRFAVTLVAPSTEDAGPFRFSVGGGALRSAYPYNGTLLVPTFVKVDAQGLGLFSKGFEGRASAHDETGALIAGDVLVQGPDGPLRVEPDGKGGYRFAGETSCGVRVVGAVYPGNGHYATSTAAAEMRVCGILSYLPPWLLATPWWVWPSLLALGALVAWAARRAIREHAPTLTRGPPLALRITEPVEEPRDVVGVGEAVRLTAVLSQPLPEGHRLRIGAYKRLVEVAPDDDLTASTTYRAEALGKATLRAEVVDPKGRVVTRRSLKLHVVRYAEEIERRYRALKRERVGGEADIVTPREFESWLRQRIEDVDPSVAHRLVGVFEEADYSPREAGRREFLTYLAAELGLGGSRTRAP